MVVRELVKLLAEMVSRKVVTEDMPVLVRDDTGVSILRVEDFKVKQGRLVIDVSV